MARAALPRRGPKKRYKNASGLTGPPVPGYVHSVVAPEEPSVREEHERESRAERLVPELLRRIFEAGYERLSDGPENLRQFVSDLKLPKEALAILLAQIEDGRHGLYRAVGGEVRDFLQRTSLSDEIRRAISGLTFEIKTQIRVVPKESPEVPSHSANDSARPNPSTE